jgi:hypothetical protein
MASHPLLQRDILGVLVEKLSLREIYLVGFACRTTRRHVFRDRSPAIARVVAEKKNGALRGKFDEFVRRVYASKYSAPIYATVQWEGPFTPGKDTGDASIDGMRVGWFVEANWSEPFPADTIRINITDSPESFEAYCPTFGAYLGGLRQRFGMIPDCNDRSAILWHFLETGKELVFESYRGDFRGYILVNVFHNVAPGALDWCVEDENVVITKERWRISFSEAELAAFDASSRPSR